MNTPLNPARRIFRLFGIGLMIGLAAYWTGARWGHRDPSSVEAVLDTLKPGELTAEEALNVRIYRQASPAVANIVTRAVEYDFFLNPVPVEGAGSGFVIDARGYILTNFHVVQQAQTIEVTLGDKSRFQAKFVGGDARNDVALLKIDPRGRKLSALVLADSGALQVGQRVLAIGNPFGFQSTLTTGVISALGRTVQTGEQTFIDEAIQTDAAINRGNSGGPLLNSHGEVIGINSAIFAPTGTTAGIGFAIPVNTAKQIAQDLINEGRVRRAFLGVEGTEIWPNLAEALSLPVADGFLVERVTPNGPAARAGIRGGDRRIVAGMRYMLIGGDIIVAINGQKISNQLEMNLALNRKRPGDSINVTIYRGREKMDVKVTLTER
ncbi:MAG: trypsin-like peptidase domain-containing protein [Acidobacteria bacterium]|nr:trypsin-like peptidase domain-containing protein [Acidobacteriota bacterium]